MERGVGGDSFRDDALFNRDFHDFNICARHADHGFERAVHSYYKQSLGRVIVHPLTHSVYTTDVTTYTARLDPYITTPYHQLSSCKGGHKHSSPEALYDP